MPSLRTFASRSNAVTTKTMMNRTGDRCGGVLKECFKAIVCYRHEPALNYEAEDGSS